MLDIDIFTFFYYRDASLITICVSFNVTNILKIHGVGLLYHVIKCHQKSNILTAFSVMVSATFYKLCLTNCYRINHAKFQTGGH